MNPIVEAVLGIATLACLLAVPTYADWLLRKRRARRLPVTPAPVPAESAPLVAVQLSATEAVPYDRGPVVVAPREDL